MRRLALALVLLLVVVFAAPAVAGHVQEPTAEVRGLELHVFQYPNTQNRIDCSLPLEDQPAVDWQNARIVAYVHVAGSPSEHFQTRVHVKEGSEDTPLSLTTDWDAVWLHQNVPPHSPRRWRNAQANEWNQRNVGYWVGVTVNGHESGNEFFEECFWRVQR